MHEALTALTEIYHGDLMTNSDALAWFQNKYAIGQEMIGNLKIGLADNGSPCIQQLLMEGPGAFTESDLLATSAFRRPPRR